jgi:hypothetical protein
MRGGPPPEKHKMCMTATGSAGIPAGEFLPALPAVGPKIKSKKLLAFDFAIGPESMLVPKSSAEVCGVLQIAVRGSPCWFGFGLIYPPPKNLATL